MNTEVLLLASNLVTLALGVCYFIYSQTKLNKKEITVMVTYDESREDGWFSDIHKITTFGQICMDGIPVGARFVLSEQCFEQIKEENVRKALDAVKPMITAGVKVLVAGAA